MEGDSVFNLEYRYHPQKMNEAVPFSMEESCGRLNIADPIKLIVKYGNLEQQTADILSAPLYSKKADLDVLNVTKALRMAAGNTFAKLFNFALNGRKSLEAGSLFEMSVTQESYSLMCKFVIFIALDQWNGDTGSSVKDLKKGICDLLGKCNFKNVASLAMSTIGVGFALAFPPEVTAKIIGEEIKSFVERNPNTSIKEIQIVIKQLPENDSLFIVYRETLSAIDFGNGVIVCNEQGAVAHSIFSVTGEEVIREAQRGHKSGKKVIMTPSDNLKCNWILHCDCEKDIEILKCLLVDIFKLCNESGLKSLSLPAIGTGECRLSPQCVAKTMIEAIFTLARKPNRSLTRVHLIIFNPYIYHIFCTELQRHF
ncbi:protein mono-ADP-ribosyltransferase PARP14-like isoform 2-T2 [Mantella aurantiaca]